jgi:hypothetical protein
MNFDYPGLGIVVQSLLRHVMSQLLCEGIVNVQLGQLPKSKARGFVSFCDPPRPLKLRNTHWFATFIVSLLVPASSAFDSPSLLKPEIRTRR